VSGNFYALMQGYPGPGLPCETDLALSRTSGLILKSTLARHNPVLSLACSPETNTIVAGSELVSSQAIVAFWYVYLVEKEISHRSLRCRFVHLNSPQFEFLRATKTIINSLTFFCRDIRSPQTPRLQYVESHNDDITEVSLVTLPQDLGIHPIPKWTEKKRII